MAHIAGKTFVASDRVYAMDEGNENFEMSAPLGAVSGLVSVGRLDLPDFRGYVATTGGNIAFFQISDLNVPPQLFHVTDLPVLWSLYHAAGVLYLGTGDFSVPGPFALIAIDDRTFIPRWQVASSGPIMFPVGVGYQGNVPKQVIVSSGNPNPVVRALDVTTGAELWSAPDTAFGQRVHQEVVYYGNLSDSTLRAR
jgi:outer membrane protein assembly factor BamB